METESPEQIAKHYKAMGDSVWFINAVIDGNLMETKPAAEKKAAVKRNVDHLVLMRAKPYWTNEDMSAVNAAITRGQAYV